MSDNKTTPPGYDLEVGDIVVLKSGGALMTVNHIQCNRTVTVQWFAGVKMKRAFVSYQSIRKATDSEMGVAKS